MVMVNRTLLIFGASERNLLSRRTMPPKIDTRVWRSVLADPRPLASTASPEAYVIDQCAQNARSMSTLWIVQIVPGKWRAEFFEHRDKLAACECITYVRLERQRDANPGSDQTTVERR